MRISILVAVLFLSVRSFGTTYFVDATSGSDANNGTAAATPWQHCPGDVSATGTAAATTLAAGDVVTFKGGVNYTNTIYANWSGTGASPITYDGNSTGSFGTGKAIFDGNYLITNGIPGQANFGAAWVLTNRNGITIRNFQVQHVGGVPMSLYSNYSYPTNTLPANSGFGVWLVDSTNVIVRDCLFQEMAYWTNQFPVNTSPTGQNGYGVKVYSGINVTITNCEFTRMPYPVELIAGSPASGTLLSNVTVSGCNFHNYINWMIILSPVSPGVTFNGVTITNNTFHDAWEDTSDYWWGGGNAATNGGGWPHFDGIFLGLANQINVTYSNLLICNNLFYWNQTNGGGTAWIYSTLLGGDLTVRDNICLNNYHSYGFYLLTDGPFPTSNVTPINFKFYNNSTFGSGSSYYFRWSGAGLGGDPFGAGNSIKLLNNICYLTNGDSYHTPITFLDTINSNGTFQADYNLYYALETFNQHDIAYNTNFATWQTNGYDPHGLYGDPKFVSIAGGFGTSSSTSDLHLTAGSPAIGTATNLSGYFKTDFSGTTRTVPWDMGAYAYITDPAITVQPSNQTVNLGQTATFSVTATGTAPISYFWYKQGGLIQAGSSSSYTTSPTTCAYNGNTVFVTVYNSVSQVTSSTATLTVTGCQGTVTNYVSQIGTANIGAARF